MLDALLVNEAFAFFVVFARIGGAILVMPAIGEQMIPTRVRLSVALLLTFIFTPLARESVPPIPNAPIGLAAILMIETFVGVLIGVIPRMLMSGLSYAGELIGTIAQLNNAQIFNPSVEGQAGLMTSVFSITALVLLFNTNMHHLMILAVLDSYTLFPPGEGFFTGDAVALLSETLVGSFYVGLKISMPLVMIGLVVNVGMGVLAKLMPQLQVFFVIIPLKILLSLYMVSVLFSGMMLVWLTHFEDRMVGLLQAL